MKGSNHTEDFPVGRPPLPLALSSGTEAGPRSQVLIYTAIQGPLHASCCDKDFAFH